MQGSIRTKAQGVTGFGRIRREKHHEGVYTEEIEIDTSLKFLKIKICWKARSRNGVPQVRSAIK